VKHRITDPDEPIDDQQTTLDTHILKPFRVDIARKLLVEYHIERRLSFLAIESPALKRLLEYLDPRSVKALTTANTLRADCMRYFEIAKNTVINVLSSAMSRIHLTWDLWTSPNFKAMIAITVHWTNKNWEVRSTLIAIREIEGDHDGENISEIVHAVLKEFRIVDRIGYFTGDNASNNDTAMKCLDRRIREEGGVGFDVGERRLRCFAHDMQIAVKGLLFGPKVKELETYEATADVSDVEKADWMNVKWRAFGAIGKLHNIVKYIRISPKRRAGFKTVLQDLEKRSVKVPMMDNDTRWGSVATMVEYGLENRYGIDIYCCEQTALKADVLSEEDWIELQTVYPTVSMIDIQVTKILVPFKKLTKLGQSKNNDLGSIAGVLWGFDMLLEVLEQARTEFITPENNKSHLATCIDHGWHLFKKYYKLTDDSRAYIMAATLDPRNKHGYFIQKWEKKHWPDMRRKTESIFEEFKLSHNVGASMDISSFPSVSDGDLIDDFDISDWRFGGTRVPKDNELQRYLKSPLMILRGKLANKEFNVLAWWKANQGEYPILTQIAIDLYAIPGMSAEVERVFSGFIPPFVWFIVQDETDYY
jgi:hypothetical protein